MKTRALITSVCIAIAFVVGRMSVNPMKPNHLADQVVNPSTCGAANASAPEPAAETKLSTKGTPQGVQTPVPVAPSVAVDGALNSIAARGSSKCLASVSRSELAEWIAALDARMEQFQRSDAQFASRNKMSPVDWKRTEASGGVNAAIAFKFESAISAEVEVQFKEGRLSFSVEHRSRKDSVDLQTHKGSQPLQNGYSIGLEHNGSGYHVVFENPVKTSGWVDYSNFAFSVPYDWDRKSEASAEVFGLTEAMKWEKVGSAILVHSSK